MDEATDVTTLWRDAGPEQPGPPVEHSHAKRYLKRIYDFEVAIAAIGLLLPVMVLIALAVKLTSRGPILFAHTRIGLQGREFRCLKFRTMAVDAEERLAELLRDPVHAAEFRENHKLRKDPRVTPLGRFLRASSLDELPQFFNVLAGHMSVVGPRPIVHEELERYGDAAAHYLSVRPGVTGPWQVSGRSDTTFAQRVAMDRAYVESLSLRSDLRVTAATVGVMLRRVGAY